MQCVSIRTGGKKRFKTEDEAQRAAKRVSKRSGNTFNYYKCRWCGYYHIGRSKWGERMIRDKGKFPLVHAEGQDGILLRKDGTKWYARFRCKVNVEEIRENIHKGHEYEAEVAFYERGSPRILSYKEKEGEIVVPIEEQREEYNQLGGDY